MSTARWFERVPSEKGIKFYALRGWLYVSLGAGVYTFLIEVGRLSVALEDKGEHA